MTRPDKTHLQYIDVGGRLSQPAEKWGHSGTRFDPNGPAVQKMRQRVRSLWTVRAFLLTKLPLALFAGIRVAELDAEQCAVIIPYGWRTTNPFKSIYFAAQAAAAEMAAGCMALPVVHAAPEPVSILIVGMEAQFLKKANQPVTFRCTQGAALAEAIAQTVHTGEPVTLQTQSVGTMPDGTVVSTFSFSWSFRRKRP